MVVAVAVVEMPLHQWTQTADTEPTTMNTKHMLKIGMIFNQKVVRPWPD